MQYWYWPMGGDAKRPVTVALVVSGATYHQVYGFGPLRADGPEHGSVPELYIYTSNPIPVGAYETSFYLS